MLQLAQSLNQTTLTKVQNVNNANQPKLSEYVSSNLIKSKPPVSMDMTPSKLSQDRLVY